MGRGVGQRTEAKCQQSILSSWRDAGGGPGAQVRAGGPTGRGRSGQVLCADFSSPATSPRPGRSQITTIASLATSTLLRGEQSQTLILAIDRNKIRLLFRPPPRRPPVLLSAAVRADRINRHQCGQPGRPSLHQRHTSKWLDLHGPLPSRLLSQEDHAEASPLSPGEPSVRPRACALGTAVHPGAGGAAVKSEREMCVLLSAP